jgi:5-methylcytosine-specific restriction endonuclease McrA
MTQTKEHRRLIRLAGAANSKARRLKASGTISAEDIGRLYLSGRQCAYCGVGLDPGHFSIDHRLAFDRGGRNEPANLAITCFSCNRRKHTKTPEEFAQHQKLLVTCQMCGKQFQPRWGEWKAGRARVCSRSCAAKLRWANA